MTLKETHRLLKEMAVMQHDLNQGIAGGEDWIRKRHPYYRAAWVECAELLEHHGWKWWKKQEPNIEQAKIELVDIWHFALSDWWGRNPHWIRDGEFEIDRTGWYSSAMFHLETPVAMPMNFLETVESFAGFCLAEKSISAIEFRNMMAALPMTFEELYRGYLGKHVLNEFRQKFGYANGTYVKFWGGKEDNEHLAEIMDGLELDEKFSVNLRFELGRRYGELSGR